MGLIGRGIYTNLIDNRSSQHTEDKISFVQGDLFSLDTWSALKVQQQAIAPMGVDLVLHRPYGGLQDLPKDCYVEGASYALDLIRSGGILYAQIPVSPYETPDYKMLRTMYDDINSLGTVKHIEISDRTKTLSNHNFVIIEKA